MAIRGTVCAGVHSEPERAKHQIGIRRECAPKCLRLPWGKGHSLEISEMSISDGGSRLGSRGREMGWAVHSITRDSTE